MIVTWDEARELSTRLPLFLTTFQVWGFPKPSLFRHQLQVQRSPRLPLVLIIHWKDSQNLLKVIILTITVYYSYRIQIKIIQGKTCRGQSPGKFQVWHFHLSSFVEKKTTLLPWQQCVTTHIKYCQPGKLHCTWVSRVFTGALSCSHG